MIAELIYGTLMANTAIQAIVAGRIYPLQGNQTATLPAIIYVIEGEERTAPAGMNEMFEHQVRISMYSTNYLELDTLSDLVQDALDPSPVVPTGYNFEGAYLIDTDEGIDQNINAYNKDLVIRIFTNKK